MRAPSLVVPVLLGLTLILTGCFGSEPQRTGPGTDTGGGDRDEVFDQNRTGNHTGNATIGTVGNATAGNETGNVSEGNATLNATGPNTTMPEGGELSNSTYIFTPSPPQDVTFEVNFTYPQLRVHVVSDGFVAGLRVVLVDPNGNETRVFESGLSTGSPEEQVTLIPAPATGTWSIRFEGAGVGSVSVVVTAEATAGP